MPTSMAPNGNERYLHEIIRYTHTLQLSTSIAISKLSN
jgi:hypothetical protein